uniref:CD81 molecule n=1 Tax=Oryctolagus cuniculus TaxID=9986 RepID=G1TLQ5_RABIT
MWRDPGCLPEICVVSRAPPAPCASSVLPGPVRTLPLGHPVGSGTSGPGLGRPAGGVILGVALWLRHDPQTTNLLYLELGDRPAPNTFYVGIYILIAVGAVMMFVGFLGCYGAIQESQCLLGTFFTCLVILFACEVAAGIWGFVNKDQVGLVLLGPTGLGRGLREQWAPQRAAPLPPGVLTAPSGPCLSATGARGAREGASGAVGTWGPQGWGGGFGSSGHLGSSGLGRGLWEQWAPGVLRAGEGA